VVKDFIKIAPPSPQELERRKAVKDTLSAFKGALQRITSTALNIQGSNDKDFSILQQFFKPKSPSSHSD
jgi:hypothetical protein